MISQLRAIEISQRTARIPLRERLQSHPEALEGLTVPLTDAGFECLVLSTCLRLELYVASARGSSGMEYDTLAECLGLSREEWTSSCRHHQGFDAATHLYRIACGLESLVLGEDHVLGQIRSAFLCGQDRGSAGPILSALFRGAIHTGRRVRRETALGRLAGNYGQLARNHLRRVAPISANVVLVGSGTLAHEIGQALRNRGTMVLTVVSRHHARAESLARKIGGRAAPYEALSEILRHADVAVTCTSSSAPIVVRDILATRVRPLEILDFGMPRNVDPAVADLPCARLTHLEDLTDCRRLHERLEQEAMSIIAAERERFADWLRRHEEARAKRLRQRRGDGRNLDAGRRRRSAPNIPVRVARERVAQ